MSPLSYLWFSGERRGLVALGRTSSVVVVVVQGERASMGWASFGWDRDRQAQSLTKSWGPTKSSCRPNFAGLDQRIRYE